MSIKQKQDIMTYFKMFPGYAPFAYRNGSACAPASAAGQKQSAQGHIPVNVAEALDHWVLELAVPGLSKSDIKISIEGELLKVSGQKTPGTAEGLEYKRRDFTPLNIEKSFRLPKNADINQIQASSADGILSIRIAKTETEKPLTSTIPVM